MRRTISVVVLSLIILGTLAFWKMPKVTSEVGAETVPHLSILGDVNLDGTVDTLDSAELESVFDYNAGHPLWNGQADLNLDQTVDVQDAITLANNFGRKAYIIDPTGDVSIQDAKSADLDITRTSVSSTENNLVIRIEVAGTFAAGYFVLLDTDQNRSTRCSGSQELDTTIGADYFIHFSPINYPAAQLCSSYRPWIMTNGLQQSCSQNVLTLYLPISDIGVTGHLIQINLVTKTFFQDGPAIYRDRSPNEGAFSATVLVP